jgi:hypothetical protein
MKPNHSYRTVCNLSNKYPRTIVGLSKRLKISQEKVEALVNKGVNEGHMKRTDRGSVKGTGAPHEFFRKN